MMKRCTRCILPETYPDIQFDENGVCSKCHEHDKFYLNRDYEALGEKLGSIITWAKKQNKKYDCVVPFSGGKDSAYTLYMCRKVYGMKTLAVNFNNGLRTTEAIKNIEKIIKKADSAYACYGPSWETMRKLYREFFFKTGQFCFPCDMGIWVTVHRIAEQYDVPLIVSGFSSQIESRGAKIYSYNNHLFETIAKNVISKKEMEDFLGETNLQKIKRRVKHGTFLRYRQQISLPEFIEWDDKIIKNTIYKELGWEKREDGSSDHIDCLFAPMKNYLVVQKWGFGEKTTKYSSMIRAGQIKRNGALQEVEKESFVEPKAIDNFVKMLDISKEVIVEAAKKTHLTYL